MRRLLLARSVIGIVGEPSLVTDAHPQFPANLAATVETSKKF